MIVAGLLRRRSGFLAFVTIVLTLLMASSTATPAGTQLSLGSYRPGSLGGDARIIQPLGTAYIPVTALRPERPATITIDQGAGDIHIEAFDGVRVTFEIECGSCAISLYQVDADGGWESTGGSQLTSGDRDRWTGSLGTVGPPVHVVIHAGASRIELISHNAQGDQQ